MTSSLWRVYPIDVAPSPPCDVSQLQMTLSVCGNECLPIMEGLDDEPVGLVLTFSHLLR
jgi:hypothetical protein